MKSSNDRIKKTVRYHLQTKDGRPWGGGIKRKREAIRFRNKIWKQIDVVRITTIIEPISLGKV